MNLMFWNPTVKDKQHYGSVKFAMSKSVEIKSQEVMYAACKKQEKISKIYLLQIENIPRPNLSNQERLPPHFSHPPPSTNLLRPRTPVSPDPSILIGNQGNQGQPLHGYPFTPAVGLNVRPEHHQSAPPGSQV